MLAQDQYHKGLPGQFDPWNSDIDHEEVLKRLVRQPKPIRFDWENRWLRGDQYAHMLYNYDHYARVFGMQVLDEKMHPENIYTDPKSKFSLLFHSL
jgi:hypothetical protein